MLKVENLHFGYSPSQEVLRQIDFQLGKGQHLCVMGESGCGKSTLLKLIYGLLDANKGSLYWNQQQILGPNHHLVPGMAFIKYVAQDFDLMPFTSVSENISKYLSRFYPVESKKRTAELLEIIEMTAFSETKVKHLSGGQQQRVAIARALASEPELLLLDEPFSQIDNFKKNTLRRKLFAFLKTKKIACIVATHDKYDALSFSDHLIVIKDKTIVANGVPKSIYNTPSSLYIGSLFDDINEIKTESETLLRYPHQIQIVASKNTNACIKNSYFNGSHWLLEAIYKNQTIYFNHFSSIEKGTEVYVVFDTD